MFGVPQKSYSTSVSKNESGIWIFGNENLQALGDVRIELTTTAASARMDRAEQNSANALLHRFIQHADGQISSPMAR